MTKALKHSWVLFRNVLIVFFILEIVFAIIYNYKDIKVYDDTIDLKIEAKIHDGMSDDEIRDMYHEFVDLEMQWKPYIHYAHKAYQGKYNTIDANGRRKTSQFINRTARDTINISCFGGSTMYGFGSADSTTIQSLLSKELSRRYSELNFKVVNYGIYGLNRRQEDIILDNEIIKGSIPDIVIFLDGVNEVLSAHQNGDTGIPTNSFNRNLEFNSAKTYKKKFLLFLRSSFTNRFIKYAKKKLRSPSTTINTDSLSLKIAENYRFFAMSSKYYEDTHNIRVFNFIQPTMFSKESLSSYEKKLDPKQLNLRAIYKNTYAYLKKDSILNNLASYSDISAVFDNTKTSVFTDFCHTTEKGNEIIAKQISTDIEGAIISIMKDPID